MLNETWSAWHLLALVLSIGSVFVLYQLVMIFIQLKSTLKTLESTISLLEKDLLPIINNLEGITGNFENITQKTDSIMENVQIKAAETMETISTLSSITAILKHSIFLFLNNLSRYFSVIIKLTGLNKDKKSLEDFSFNSIVNKSEIVDHLVK